MRVYALAIWLGLLGVLLPGPCSSEECVQFGDYLHWVGNIGTMGYAHGVAVLGDFAYVTDQTPGGLAVVDVTDPASPLAVGFVSLPDAEGVAVSGTHAYVAGVEGLAVIDVADARAPFVTGSIATAGPAHDVAIVGTNPDIDHQGVLACVAAEQAGLVVVDITDASSPQIIGNLSLGRAARGVAMRGRYAYVAADTLGLQVVDIADPRHPRVVGGVGTGSWAYDVAIEGDHAYVADNGTGLHVIDISDPVNPRRVGGIFTIYELGVAVQGSHVYLPSEYWGLSVVDVSDPANPRVVGNVDNQGGRSLGVAVSPTHAYVANSWAGLEVIDIANPEDPITVEIYSSVSNGVAVSGNLACVVAQGAYGDYSGIRVIDISDPDQPELVGYGYLQGNPRHVAMSAGFAYVAHAASFVVWDISTPSDPRLTAVLELTSAAYQIALSGSLAFVANFNAGLTVIDISTPSQPAIVTSLDVPYAAVGVALAGTHAYVTCSAAGLQVIDIADPRNPRIVGSIDPPGIARQVAIAGDFAYVTRASDGLAVFDVSDPESPHLVSSLDTGGYAEALSVDGHYAYIGSAGMKVIDIADPETPRIVATVHVENPRNLLVQSSSTSTRAYLADGGTGFVILPNWCPSTDSGTAGFLDAPPLPGSLGLCVTPNPARNLAVIRFELEAQDRAAVSIHDLAGRRVRLLESDVLRAGVHELTWDGRDGEGREVAAGVYVARVSTAAVEGTARIVILR